MATDLTRRTATELAEGIRTAALDPVEVADAFLDRVEDVDGTIRAFTTVRDREQIRRDARRVAERQDLAELPLAGVPIAIKDNIRTEGLPCRFGSPATSAEPVSEDDEVVRRIKAAGAIVLGKTALPELALTAYTDSPVSGGPTCNPWDRERIAGGSSGGSAAAVAARLAPLAVGTDGLGSIRIPSACCGVFGIKPGFGLLPPAPIGHWLHQSEYGPMTTTVDDAACLLGVMAGSPVAVEPPRRRKVALWTRSTLPGVAVDRQIRDALGGLADRLERLGHDVRPGKTPRSMSVGYALMRRWSAFAAEDAQTLGLDIGSLGPFARGLAARGQKVLRKGTPSDRVVGTVRRVLADVFEHCDLVVSPVLSRPPPRIDECRGHFLPLLLRQSTFAPFTAMWNVARYPAAALPVGIDRDGLPIGAMIAGPPDAESAILSVARQLEQQRPWPRHAPS